MNDAELEAAGARRMVADAKPGFPCRVSLEDAEPGERLVLVNSSTNPRIPPTAPPAPIFVRETAREAFDGTGRPAGAALPAPVAAGLRCGGIDGGRGCGGWR